MAIETKPPTSSVLSRTGRAVSLFVIIALAFPVGRWAWGSPVLEVLDQRSRQAHWQSSPDLAKLGPYRLEYFQNVTIEHGDRVANVTCVLCSVTVHGSVRQVEALWGDVTVESDGSVGEGIRVFGGRLTVLAGGHANFIQGETETANIDIVQPIQPNFFYPGQRSFPGSGVNLFVAVVVLTLTCGSLLPTEALRECVATAVRGPIWTVFFGIVLVASVPLLEFIGIISMYIFRTPWTFPLFFYVPLAVYWVLLAIGLANLSLQVGSLLGVGASPLAKYVRGACVILVAMLIPVLGFFAMAAVIFVALGAGALGLARTRSDAPSKGAHPLS